MMSTSRCSARGAAVWNEWRAETGEAPDLSRASLRGLDLSVVRPFAGRSSGRRYQRKKLRDTDLSGAHLEGANLFKAVLDGANLAGAFLTGAQFLNCAQLAVTRNWQSAFRDDALACGAAIPDPKPGG